MKRLIPRLLAVGVILGMGGVSIMQGLRGSSANNDQAETSASDTPNEDAAESTRVLAPVVSIDALDSEPPVNHLATSRFADSPVQHIANDTTSRFAEPDDVVSGIDREADPISRVQNAGDVPLLIAEATTQVPIVTAQVSRESTATLPFQPPVANPSVPSESPMSSPALDDLYVDYNLARDSELPRKNSLISSSTTPSPVSDVTTTPHSDAEIASAGLPAISDSTVNSDGTIPHDNAQFESSMPGEGVASDNVEADSTAPTDVPSQNENRALGQSLTAIATPSPPTFSSLPVDDRNYATVAQSRQPAAHRDQFDTGAPASVPVSDRSFATGVIGTGRPGKHELEGMQIPSVSLVKNAPSEVQIGKLAEFQLIVRNVGKVTVKQVIVQDQIPEGTRLIGAVPDITEQDGETLYWDLGTLEPGEEVIVAMQVMPEVDGEIGSVGTIMFRADASVRTVATRPMLKLEHTVTPKVNVGETVSLQICVSNPGTGAATSVVLEEDVPDGLSHPAGAALERELGTIKPGETREVVLTLTAERAGLIENVIVARADANLVVEDRAQLQVIAPQLQVHVQGPARRYLERQATYALLVENTGTAPATNVELVAHLPKGMKFVETNNAGQYDPRTHAVYWSLEELPAQQSGDVELITLPIEPGEQKLRFEGQADAGLKDSLEQKVTVEGLPSLFFEVADTEDPIEMGNETVYEIRLVNEGSASATDILVQADFSSGLKPLDGDGPTGSSRIEAQQIAFPPLRRLEPSSDVYYKVRVHGLDAGDQRIRVQVQSKEQIAVSEEESTRVYADN